MMQTNKTIPGPPKEYTVYLELFGKKMKTSILAESEEDAKKIVREKIIFHAVKFDASTTHNKMVADLDDLFKNLFK